MQIRDAATSVQSDWLQLGWNKKMDSWYTHIQQRHQHTAGNIKPFKRNKLNFNIHHKYPGVQVGSLDLLPAEVERFAQLCGWCTTIRAATAAAGGVSDVWLISRAMDSKCKKNKPQVQMESALHKYALHPGINLTAWRKYSGDLRDRSDPWRLREELGELGFH